MNSIKIGRYLAGAILVAALVSCGPKGAAPGEGGEGGVPEDFPLITAQGVEDYPNRSSTGAFSDKFDWPVIAINMVVLPNGSVLTLGTTNKLANQGGGAGQTKFPNNFDDSTRYDWQSPAQINNHFTPGIVNSVWDPRRGTASNAFASEDTSINDPQPFDAFCAGQALLPNGDVLMVGGQFRDSHGSSNPQRHGLNYDDRGEDRSRLFDFRSTSSRYAGGSTVTMRFARWYPTATTLPDGNTLIQGGSIAGAANEAPHPEIWNTTGTAYQPLTAAQTPSPSMDKVSGLPAGDVPPNITNIYDTDNQIPGTGRSRTSYYPFSFVSPSGKVFVAGPNLEMWYIDWSGSGRLIYAGRREGNGVQDNLASDYRFRRDYGTAVMFDVGKILVLGGWEENPQNTAVEVDITNDSGTLASIPPKPVVTATASPMSVARRHMNATLLPDGQVLVTGGVSAPGFNGFSNNLSQGSFDRVENGGQGNRCAKLIGTSAGNATRAANPHFDPNLCELSSAVYKAEVYNPATRSFSDLATPQGAVPSLTKNGQGAWVQTDTSTDKVVRSYHSTSVLLANGSVLMAGGGRSTSNALDQFNAQVFYPPFFFNADGSLRPRLRITRAPSAVSYDQRFNISVDSPTRVSRVTLVRLGATTHAFDQSQRFLDLSRTSAVNQSWSRTGSGLRISAPKNANVAPPGYYYLFVLDAQGTPSVAQIVNLR